MYNYIGEHEVEFTFGGTKKVLTSFTISEEEITPVIDDLAPTDESNPTTGDDIMKYVYMLIISIMNLIGTGVCFKKNI